MVRIAVEHPFTDVQRAFKKKGYQTDMVNKTRDVTGYDVIVVRHQAALKGARTEASVVETRGRSVMEIVKEVEERLQRAGKISGTADAAKSGSGGGFSAGILTGAVVGALTALLLAPKSGKELQSNVKEKAMKMKDTKGKATLFETVPDGFRVVTVGSGSPLTEVGRNAPSTLVQFKDKYFLVDCGASTTSKLTELGLPSNKITNMLFTHQHVDHNGDFWTFFIDGWQGSKGRRALNLAGPLVRDLYDTTVNFFKEDLEYRTGLGTAKDGALTNVHITDFTEDQHSFELDGVKISAIPVPHSAPTYAFRFDAGGQSVVVSGDLTYTENLGPFAKDADILVLDGMMTSDFSGIPEKNAKSLKEGLEKSHAIVEDLARMAAESGAKKVVLTHLGLGETETERVYKEFSAAGCKSEIVVAYDGLAINP